jgi:hypothetical protein
MRSERGSAVAAFVLVSPLLVLVCLGALQVVMLTVIRMSATAVALESARVGATWDGGRADAVNHARSALGGLVNERMVRSVTARNAVAQGQPVMEVRITMRVPIIGPWPARDMSVMARALEERR